MENKTLKPKRIGIDARFYGPIGKGLGRYTQEIVDNIIKLDQENYYVIFLNRENFYQFKTLNPRVKKILADVRWYGLAEQLIFPFYILNERLDLMHFPHFNVPIFCPVKFVVTIHDLILLKYPTMRATTLGPRLYRLKNWAYKLVITAAVRRAKKVIAVSEFTKQDLIKQFRLRREKITVTYEGIANLDNVVLDKAGEGELVNIKPPYLLYVGNAYPHKNLERLINVFSELKPEFPDFKLVLVGKEDYFYHRLKETAKNNPAVIFPGYVPDQELAGLYRNALAYVFPSFYEGFGLPPLEAMAHGLPVASSNKASLPEILGDAALYFNPEEKNEMLEKIRTLIADENLRSDLRAKGFELVKKYSWRDCAEKTLATYKSLL